VARAPPKLWPAVAATAEAVALSDASVTLAMKLAVCDPQSSCQLTDPL
jgi:hypothetical protein